MTTKAQTAESTDYYFKWFPVKYRCKAIRTSQISFRIKKKRHLLAKLLCVVTIFHYHTRGGHSFENDLHGGSDSFQAHARLGDATI